MKTRVNGEEFIENIKQLDNIIWSSTKLLDPIREKSLFTTEQRIKWFAYNNGFIYKAMGKDTFNKLQASFNFLKQCNFSCFEPFEIIFEGYFLIIIKQKILKRILSSDITDRLIISVIEKEILEKYPSISFFPNDSLSACQMQFYIDYPEEFFTLMSLMTEFKIRDALCPANCGIDENGKIKCFDFEFRQEYPQQKLENFIQQFFNNKDC